MDKIAFKQEKPLKVKLVAGLLLVFGFFVWFIENAPTSQRIVLSILPVILFGYSVSYEITKKFKNQRVFSIFKIQVFKTTLKIDFPEYITVFGASFKQGNEWGTTSALGTTSKSDGFVIRFFKGNSKFTVYKTNNYELALEKAKQLANMLNVEIYDPSKE